MISSSPPRERHGIIWARSPVPPPAHCHRPSLLSDRIHAPRTHRAGVWARTGQFNLPATVPSARRVTGGRQACATNLVNLPPNLYTPARARTSSPDTILQTPSECRIIPSRRRLRPSAPLRARRKRSMFRASSCSGDQPRPRGAASGALLAIDVNNAPNDPGTLRSHRPSIRSIFAASAAPQQDPRRSELGSRTALWPTSRRLKPRAHQHGRAPVASRGSRWHRNHVAVNWLLRAASQRVRGSSFSVPEGPGLPQVAGHCEPVATKSRPEQGWTYSGRCCQSVISPS